MVFPNITNFNSNSWTMLIGVAVTSFEGIGLILPIQSSMSQPEKFLLFCLLVWLLLPVFLLVLELLDIFHLGIKLNQSLF